MRDGTHSMSVCMRNETYLHFIIDFEANKKNRFYSLFFFSSLYLLFERVYSRTTGLDSNTYKFYWAKIA